jgi:hypothetical protein
VIVLGTLPGETDSFALAVCGNGNAVVGTTRSIGGRAFRWTAAGGIEELPPLIAGAPTSANDCTNDAAIAVGFSGIRGSDFRKRRGIAKKKVLPRAVSTHVGPAMRFRQGNRRAALAAGGGTKTTNIASPTLRVEPARNCGNISACAFPFATGAGWRCWWYG